MTTDDQPDHDERPAGEFDWDAPRWRSDDHTQSDVEHESRLHDDDAPPPSGAIDDDDAAVDVEQHRPSSP